MTAAAVLLTQEIVSSEQLIRALRAWKQLYIFRWLLKWIMTTFSVMNKNNNFLLTCLDIQQQSVMSLACPKDQSDGKFRIYWWIDIGLNKSNQKLILSSLYSCFVHLSQLVLQRSSTLSKQLSALQACHCVSSSHTKNCISSLPAKVKCPAKQVTWPLSEHKTEATSSRLSELQLRHDYGILLKGLICNIWAPITVQLLKTLMTLLKFG